MLNNDGIGLILNNQKLFTRNAENLSIMETFVGDVMYNTVITFPKIRLSWIFLTFIIFHFIDNMRFKLLKKAYKTYQRRQT